MQTQKDSQLVVQSITNYWQREQLSNLLKPTPKSSPLAGTD